MADLVQRFAQNPLITPASLPPSAPGLRVVCTLNPGAFERDGKIWLLARIAEGAVEMPGRVRVPIMREGVLAMLDYARDDPLLDTTDPREFRYNGVGLLSTLSHLRLLMSEDGVMFRPADNAPLLGEGYHESFGIEDCRVHRFADGQFVLTYTAVSPAGYGVGCRLTRDWKNFESLGLLFPTPNKDCAIFEERINGDYVCVNRPSSCIVGGNDIWISFSPDLRHWGRHRCLLRCRPGHWDGQRIGANGPPLRTADGWLLLYHGANPARRYCLGAVLLDLQDPTRVLARTAEPFMEPTAPYELAGFLGSVVFSNGHLRRGNELTLYYGASDTVICGATVALDAIMRLLQPVD